MDIQYHPDHHGHQIVSDFFLQSALLHKAAALGSIWRCRRWALSCLFVIKALLVSSKFSLAISDSTSVLIAKRTPLGRFVTQKEIVQSLIQKVE
jgi:hypothetical protein